MEERAEKVLILGSGALKIGEAGEFDYSGSQAIKALKEEGVKTVLVNPNIATIQTSEYLADKVYFLPVTPDFVERVIEREHPDGILLSFGGQTALNCGLALADSGVLERSAVAVLGTPIEAIRKTEDRDLFAATLRGIGVEVPRSAAATSLEQALSIADDIGYPVIVRAAFALGGEGSGVARDSEELRTIVVSTLSRLSGLRAPRRQAAEAVSQPRPRDLATRHSESAGAPPDAAPGSPSGKGSYGGESLRPQVLVEEYLAGWKEVEYEVVRDRYDNSVSVCNMENLDPLGIHTGESIVVAPSQTLTNSEYHLLREISIRVIRHLGIIGECNIQFALDPRSEEYKVIEVNARLSRSSALASKATGYPLAFVAGKLALGYALTNLTNSITRATTACFEPALDYVVVKIPRWDLNKFKVVSKRIGSEMKSVGEVMAIGRTFEEALQKAVRMLQVGMKGLTANKLKFEDLDDIIAHPTDMRLFAIAEAIGRGYPIERISSLSGIDPWFIQRMARVIDFARELEEGPLLPEVMRRAKQLGFSDYQIGFHADMTEQEVRELRKHWGILPFVKQIDTLAGEFPAKTNYLYLTYCASEHDVAFSFEIPNFGISKFQNFKIAKLRNPETDARPPAEGAPVMVLGSGAYRIGSSVEFDWCCVNCILTLRELGFPTIMVNYNPETVSTDYDTCDKLYFEELSFERVQDIYELEKPAGVIVSMGGQIPNDLALRCHRAGMRVLGTSPLSIDRAEDRHKFSKLLDSLGIDQPEWTQARSLDEVKSFASRVGYPVLIRPSYVLSGAAMNVVFTEDSLEKYLQHAANVSPEHPVVVTKFLTKAKEIEIDAVANKGRLAIWAISEHVENAGVHSGDATLVLPPQKTYLETVRRIRQVTRKIAQALEITGPFNIQFLAKDNEVKVIECNLRASRSFPFVSKVFKHNFIEVATRAIMGAPVPEISASSLELDYVGVKASQFSFSRLKGADPITGVEMASTGEVGCLGTDLHDAFLKAILSTGFRIPEKNVLVSVSGDRNRYALLETVAALGRNGFTIYATEHTHEFLTKHGVPAELLYKMHEKREPNALTYLTGGKIDLVISMPDVYGSDYGDTYHIRRMAVDFSIPLLNDVQMARLFVNAILKNGSERLDVRAWDEY